MPRPPRSAERVSCQKNKPRAMATETVSRVGQIAPIGPAGASTVKVEKVSATENAVFSTQVAASQTALIASSRLEDSNSPTPSPIRLPGAGLGAGAGRSGA